MQLQIACSDTLFPPLDFYLAGIGDSGRGCKCLVSRTIGRVPHNKLTYQFLVNGREFATFAYRMIRVVVKGGSSSQSRKKDAEAIREFDEGIDKNCGFGM